MSATTPVQKEENYYSLSVSSFMELLRATLFAE